MTHARQTTHSLATSDEPTIEQFAAYVSDPAGGWRPVTVYDAGGQTASVLVSASDHEYAIPRCWHEYRHNIKRTL